MRNLTFAQPAMPQEPPATGTAPRKSSLGCLITALILLVGYIAAQFLVFHQVSTGFLARAAEADPIIEAVYLSDFETGKWPENLESLGRPEFANPPQGWRYLFYEALEPPILDNRHGPLHMSLVYQFRKAGNPNSPGGWRATCEGTPVQHTFEERIPPRPPQKAN